MQLQTNKTIIVELFGEKLILSERTARDQYILAEYSKGKEIVFTEVLMQTVIIAQDGLKINLQILKWWQILKKYRLKKLLSKDNLLNNLSYASLESIALKVLELEGRELKKKVTENQVTQTELAGVSQTV